MTWESAEMILWKCRVATIGPPSHTDALHLQVALRLSRHAGIHQPLLVGPLYWDRNALQTPIAMMAGTVVIACAAKRRYYHSQCVQRGPGALCLAQPPHPAVNGRFPEGSEPPVRRRR